MYHLTYRARRKVRLSQRVSSPLSGSQPSQNHEPESSTAGANTALPVPGEPEPLGEPGTTQKRKLEQAPVYYLIGEPITPEPQENPTTIVLDLHPAIYEDQEEDHQADTDAQDWPGTRRPRRGSRLAPVGWTLAGVAPVMVIILVVTVIIPWFQTSATITLVPVTQTINTNLAVRLVSGTADPARLEVQGRQLSSLTMSQERTVPTTGKSYQPAQAAHGWITLYNALTNAQTVSAGTLIVAQNGIQVTTDTTVTIPAANLPVDGQIQVSVHATEPGPAGNIAALDINGPCCQSDVLAKNFAPLIGGTDAHRYQAVSVSDIQSATVALQATLTQDVTAAYQAELAAEESLLTPVACPVQAKADPPQGSEAKQVMVTLTETCQGIAYNASQMHAQVIQAMNQQAQQTEGSQAAGYQLDAMSLHIQAVPSKTHAGDVQVQASGILIYAWNQQQQSALAALIAGKSEDQAIALLEQQPGISTIGITLAGRDTGTLPSDPDRIHLVFVVSGQ